MTVLTSNKGFEEWGAILGDEVVAAALLDRIPPLLHREHLGEQLPDAGPRRTGADAPSRPREKEPRPTSQVRTRRFRRESSASEPSRRAHLRPKKCQVVKSHFCPDFRIPQTITITCPLS